MTDTRKVHYIIEYAKSSRSSCTFSKKKIQQNTIRIGRNSPSPFHDGYITKWYLPSAFFASKSKIVKELEKSEQISGFENLRMEDQIELKEMMGEDVQVDPEVMEGNKRLWKVKEALGKLSQGDMMLLLGENGLPTGGGVEDLKNRIGDAMVYGRATCATCPTQGECYLKYSYQDGVYKCKTELKWGKCGYEGNNVVIHDWKNVAVNSDDVLNNWDGKMDRPMKKILRKDVEFYERDPKAPLKGMKFSSAGRLSKYLVSDLKKLILENGGYFSENVTPDLDYVISTYPCSINAEHPKMKLCETFQICVVTELLVERLLDTFGFDQSPYVLSGPLPPIAFAKVEYVSDNSAIDMEMQLTPPGTIDSECNFKNGKVHKEADKLYDVLLSQTDASSGVNRYYRMQLIEYQNQFVVFKKWGKVGTTIGSKKSTPPSSFSTAYGNFTETFLDKTGNEWTADTYEKHEQKYFVVLMEDAESEDSYEAIFSILEPRVKKTVDLIFDREQMKSVLKSLDVDIRKLPLSKITRTQVMRGFSLLSDIEEAIINGGEESSFSISNLSNQFYTIIPTDFSKKRPEMINSIDILRDKLKQIEVLMNVAVASSLLEDTVYSNATEHPSDQNYQKLGAKLKPLSLYTKHFRIIKKYLESGYSPESLGYTIELIDAVEVTSVDFPTEFKKEFRNTRPRKLLWYGTEVSNIVGILADGLHVPPEDAPKSGYPFGKGLHFSERVESAAKRCSPSQDTPTAILLLCDVALGESLELSSTEYVEDLQSAGSFSSAKILGRTEPNPSDNMTIEEQVIVPVGAPQSTGNDTEFENSEYIVYNENQVNIKYVVTVKFTPLN